ncbi:hypothetical protein NW767_013824 [Fusarium falciforme]|nr:hypothetical protein NW767_013824 [Fusarium falciforme]
MPFNALLLSRTTDQGQMGTRFSRFPQDPYIEGASQDISKFTTPKDLAEGSSSMEETWLRCVKTGKLWAEWGHGLHDENKALWKAYASDLPTATPAMTPLVAT